MTSQGDLNEVCVRTESDAKEIAKRSEWALHRCPMNFELDLDGWIMAPKWFGMDLNKLCMSSGWGLQEVEWSQIELSVQVDLWVTLNGFCVLCFDWANNGFCMGSNEIWTISERVLNKFWWFLNKFCLNQECIVNGFCVRSSTFLIKLSGCFAGIISPSPDNISLKAVAERVLTPTSCL